MSQRTLFLTEPSASARVAGFSYWPEAFTAAEERDWLREIEALPFKPFEFHGYLGKRRIVSFGWRYDYSGRALRAERADAGFPRAAARTGGGRRRPRRAHLQQALVTEYDAGVTIGWHRDKPMFEDVVALSFLSPCRLRLRRKRDSRLGALGDGDRAALALSPERAGAPRVGAQHPAGRVEALLGNLPNLRRGSPAA